ncbi:transposase IS605 [Candidatus Nitrosoglobus terrae]|uniref:IS605 transposase orf B family n=1 Tax=Candidatus Nitrosoglobus terrae TaxID=1630141 RepID=A0A1Q2SN79_9GAMM|nr:transposase [Candidatus Nitrosoglobus terrae]BAW80265.1 IS605 transposase orf B family [Candidatus Nitrosoglobus terrae]BAW80572.1 transposase IS605 [Candidatus Nitrosoglobus terrae]
MPEKSAGRLQKLPPSEPTLLPVTDKKVGIDVGIKNLFVTSDGFKSGNPRHRMKYVAKLAKYQRRLAKKKLGGKNRQKAKLKVARIHAKISDCRMDNFPAKTLR